MKVIAADGRRDVMSATTLMGDKVVNMQGESLGTVEEIMLHVESGRVAYVVMSFGGFLGIGDKLFAIPWDAFSLDEDKKQFVINVDKQKLENAPGFDKDNWPDMTDPTWANKIYDYYGYKPTWESETEPARPGSEHKPPSRPGERTGTL